MPKSVLLVDDDTLFRMVIGDGLRAADYRVAVAADGLEALEWVRETPPDFILLDLILPKLDGMRVCRILKRHPEHRTIPIILLSDLGRVGHKELEGLGAEASIAKRQAAATLHEILHTLKHLESCGLPPRPAAEAYSGLAERRIVGELLAERQHSQALLNTLGEGVVELDEGGQVVYVNAAGAAILDRPEEEIYASPGVGLLGPANSPALGEALGGSQAQEDGHTVRVEVPYGHKTIGVTLTTLQRPEGFPGTLLVLRDLTDLARRTRSLRALAAVSQHILGKLDLAAVLREVVTRTAELLRVDRCVLFRVVGSAERPQLRCIQALGVPEAAALGDAALAGEAVAQRAVAERRVVSTACGPLAMTAQWLDPRTVNPPPGDGPAVLAAPILSAREAFGALTVYRPGGHQFSEDEAELVASLAGSAAIAIENARLFRQERERRAQVEAVRDLTAESNRELDLTSLLGLITWRAVELVGAASGTVFLWDDVAQGLVPRAWHGLGDWVGTLRLQPGEGIAGAVAQRRKGLIVNDYRAWPGADPLILQRSGVTAALGEPLMYRDRLLGAITLNKVGPGQVFTPADRETLALFAAQAAIAIENAHLYAEVREYSQALERKVETRTRELQALNRELEALNRELEMASRHKSEFLANMSHELRTPLHSVLGFSDLLLGVPGTVGASPGGFNDRQAHYLKNIRGSAERLLDLINDVLDLAKVEAGRMTLSLKQMPLRRALEQAVSLARPQALENNLGLEVRLEDVPPTAVVDPRKFHQILGDLLSNAIKFTPSGGRITVEACKLPDARGELLELSVRDTGIGISPEGHHRLFQEFEQLDHSLAKRHPGTGLGLALTKRLVEMHGGRVWAVSAGVNRGSTFTFRLPCRPVSLPGDVLVVDDEESARTMIREILGGRGLRVREVAGGRDALRMIQEGVPDLIVLDLRLGKTDGYHLIRKLRRNDKTKEVAILVVTATDLEDAQLAVEQGANASLTKPFAPAALVEIAERLLEKHGRAAPGGAGAASEPMAASAP